MTDAAPFGIPVKYLRRYRVTALKPVEIEVEAEDLAQAGAMASFICLRDKVRLTMVQELADPVADIKPVVADNVPVMADTGLLDETELFTSPPGGP